MSEVTFSVGGRNYTVACAAGEEERVASLGADVDAKLQQLGGNLAPQEAQNLLFAALLLADEARETKQSQETDLAANAGALQAAAQARKQQSELTSKIAGLEQQLGSLQAAQQNLSEEAGTVRRELLDRREEAEKVRAECERVTAKQVEAEDERDAARNHAEQAEGERAKAELALAEARDENFKISKQIAALKSAQSVDQPALASASALSLASDDPDLAPALERFADMLENCAAKLESGLEGTATTS